MSEKKDYWLITEVSCNNFQPKKVIKLVLLGFFIIIVIHILKL